MTPVESADLSSEDAPTLAFTLPLRMWEEIVSHAREEAPRECCGVIAGRDGRPVRLFRLSNRALGATLYEIDSTELYDLEFRLLPAEGLEILAIYHSHPVSEAYPSVTDQALAFWPEAVYLICSLAEPDSPVVRGFFLGNGVSELVVEMIQM